MRNALTVLLSTVVGLLVAEEAAAKSFGNPALAERIRSRLRDYRGKKACIAEGRAEGCNR